MKKAPTSRITKQRSPRAAEAVRTVSATTMPAEATQTAPAIAEAVQTDLNNNDRSSTDGDSSSYQSILDTYTEKMEKAVPGLVSQYRSEASGVTDIGKLAEICNNKIGKLAGICNEGVGKMAELMNSRGDSYSTYESWAGKLMDNYSDIAQEIQDAYLDSAMY